MRLLRVRVLSRYYSRSATRLLLPAKSSNNTGTANSRHMPEAKTVEAVALNLLADYGEPAVRPRNDQFEGEPPITIIEAALVQAPAEQ